MNEIAAATYFKQFLSKLIPVFGEDEALALTNYVCAEVLLIKWHQLSYLDKYLDQHQQAYFNVILERLLKAEPIQYILGYAWFAGLKFSVNPSVLIPRPETEELVDAVKQHYRHQAPATLVDLGTGSGCIPITLKKYWPSTTVIGVDVMENALHTAQENGVLNKVHVNWKLADMGNEEQLETLLHKVQAPLCLISNPPYIAREESEQMHKNVLDFEPHEALFTPTEDALYFYRAIAKKIKNLKQGDMIWLEINPEFAKETQALFETSGCKSATMLQDMQGKQRFIVVTI